MPDKSCGICEKPFYVKPCRDKTAKFCSPMCHYKHNEGSIGYWRGKKRPELSGNLHPNWRGGRCFDPSTDYVRIYNLKHPYSDCYGYVAEHRLVMEQHLGRLLKVEETVHHINSKRNDNRLSNLMLFPTRGAHSSYHEEKKKQLKTVKKVIIYEERSV